ncbi:MAG: hypothetical protein ABJG88_11375 [Litorimonas sp.]
MATWSKNSKSPNKASAHDAGMIGGLSIDAHPDARRQSNSDTQYDGLTVGDYMTGMPNIRLTSILKGLMKQVLWIVPVFLIGLFGIYYFTKDIKRSYHGEGRLLVQIGPEYIYTPIGANNSNNTGGISQTPDTIALNEVGIMKNSDIIDQVIGIMTSPREDLSERQAQDLFNKKAFKKIRDAEASGSKREIEDAYAELHKFVSDAYYVAPKPKSSLIDVSFRHESPEIAVETVNQFIDAYRVYRRTVFVEGSEDTISERRDETERQLKSSERAIARFLERNDISDFTSEQTGLRKRSEDLKAELNTLRALMAETERSLATVEDQLRGTEQTINLYVDDRTSQRIAQAELELKQLLAKYLPTSNPVRQKRTELDELKRLQSANNGQAAGGRRVGPNPVYQALLTRRNTLKSSADSYREKEVTLQTQLNSAVGKVSRLTKLSPEHQNLLRERKTLTAALDTYNSRAQEALVNLAQAEANNENIKVISYASFAIKGKDLGKIILAGGGLLWLLTLGMIALLIVFLNPTHYQGKGTNTRTPRRGRSTDRPLPSNNDGVIPDPVAPYEPRTPMPSVASSEDVNVATRAYNLSVRKGASQSSTAAQAQAGSHAPTLYDPSAYQSTQAYGDAKNYYAAPQSDAHVTSQDPAYGSTNPLDMVQPITISEYGATDALDAQNNPYLNAQNSAAAGGNTQQTGQNVQANDLPILGSFSMSKS